jgi:hypothetical protein
VNPEEEEGAVVESNEVELGEEGKLRERLTAQKSKMPMTLMNGLFSSKTCTSARPRKSLKSSSAESVRSSELR